MCVCVRGESVCACVYVCLIVCLSIPPENRIQLVVDFMFLVNNLLLSTVENNVGIGHSVEIHRMQVKTLERQSVPTEHQLPVLLICLSADPWPCSGALQFV